MDAIAHTATRRLDSSLHAVRLPLPRFRRERADLVRDRRLPAVRGRTQGVAAERRKRARGTARQDRCAADATAPGPRRPNGVARLKLRPQFKTERGPARHQDQARAGLRSPANHRRVVPGCRAQSRARARVSRAADDRTGRQARDARRMAQPGGPGVPRRSESARRRLPTSVEAPLSGHDRSRSGAFRRQT